MNKQTAAPFSRDFGRARHRVKVGSASDGAQIFSFRDALDQKLEQRLFYECELREGHAEHGTIPKGAKEMAPEGAFVTRQVLFFAQPCFNTQNVERWLEGMFDLRVMVPRNTTFYHEWLFRYATEAGLIIIDKDSFGGEQSSFQRFAKIAREMCEEVPMIVLSRDFRVNDFDLSWSDNWDVSLQSPVSQHTLGLAIEVASDIAINGR